jgi:hypothetical protein
MQILGDRKLGFVAAVAVGVMLVHAERASADAVTVQGFLDGQLRGATVQEDLTLTFPDFTLVLPDVTHLIPGFCIECGSGTPVPFTQQTGNFSGKSPGGFNSIDANVSGHLSFVGPTDAIAISNDPFASDFLSESVHWSGSLLVTQPNRVLFNGTVSGSGTGSAVYTNFPSGNTRLDGYQYSFSGVSVTPEPASLLLIGTGVVWLARRRRKSATRS